MNLPSSSSSSSFGFSLYLCCVRNGFPFLFITLQTPVSPSFTSTSVFFSLLFKLCFCGAHASISHRLSPLHNISWSEKLDNTLHFYLVPVWRLGSKLRLEILFFFFFNVFYALIEYRIRIIISHDNSMELQNNYFK